MAFALLVTLESSPSARAQDAEATPEPSTSSDGPASSEAAPEPSTSSDAPASSEETTASADSSASRLLEVALPRGAWRVDTALAAPETAFGGTSLGEPATSGIAVGDARNDPGNYHRRFATLGVLAEASLGVSSRVDLGVRVCAMSCGPAPALLGLATRIRLMQSERNALGLRVQASNFGARSTAGSIGLSWLALRGHVLVGFTPEFSFRLGEIETQATSSVVAIVAPATIAYATERFRVGGHLGAGLMMRDRRATTVGVIPIGVDGSVLMLERRIRLEAWASFGAAILLGQDDRVDTRVAFGLRFRSN